MSNGNPQRNSTIDQQRRDGNARVGSTMTNGDNDNKVGVLNTERKVEHKKKMPKISDLDKEVEQIAGKTKT